MYTADQTADSRSVGACGVRTWATRSNSSRPTIAAIVTAQSQNGTSMGQLPPVTGSRQYRRSLPPPANRRPAGPEALEPGGPDLVMTTLPRWDTPLHNEPGRLRAQ